MSGELRFAGAGRRYGERVALHPLDLVCEAGTVTCLVGPNGAGKSTALALAAGLIGASEGAVRWGGRRVRRREPPPDTGFLPQSSSFHRALSVGEIVDFAAAARGADERQRRRLLAVTGLAPMAERFVGELSGGWVRRLGLLSALLGSPRLLLLDEPFAGLDPETHDRLLAELRRRIGGGATLLVASHDFEVLDALRPRVAVLDEGRLLAVAGGEAGAQEGAEWSTRSVYRRAMGAGSVVDLPAGGGSAVAR